MLSFLKSKILSRKIFFIFSIFFFAFLTFDFFFANKAESQSGNLVDLGDLYGWAWMGVNISTPGVSEGGGGWLRLNCKPDVCGINGAPQWGVEVNVDETSPDYGMMSGYAYSSNYGWLSFQDSDADFCYTAHPNYPTAASNTAPKVFFGEGAVTATPVRGWARFLTNDNYYDGCVSFSGGSGNSAYSTVVDQTTGALKGWAYGGNNVGWLSFQNPECAYCNTSVVLANSANIVLTANPSTINAGGSSTLSWQATGSPGLNVTSCNTYSNSSGYSHWQSGTISPPGNVGTINLPSGSHTVTNIMQNTTYQMTCTLTGGAPLPAVFATVTVTPDVVPGCMDPTATNYNINATVNDPSLCTYGPPPPGILGCIDPSAVNYNPDAVAMDPTDPCRYANLSINVAPSSFTQTVPNVGGQYVATLINWISTQPSDFAPNSCSGFFSVGTNPPIPLSGWTGPRANPNSSITNLIVPASIVEGATPGTNLNFTIRCQTISGDPVSVSDSINIAPAPVEPPPPAPSVNVSILAPDATPIGPQAENLIPGGAMVTVSWTHSNVIPSTCVGTSSQYSPDNGSPIGFNAQWNDSTNNFSAPGQMQLDMTVPGIGNGVPTELTLTCTGLDNLTQVSSTVAICIQGSYCDIISSSGIPTYQEF